MLRKKFIHLLQKIADDPVRGLIICALLTCLAYSNSLMNDFLIDDLSFITSWPLIRDMRNFPQFFGPHNQPPGEEGVYSPLKTLMHAVNYNLWGTNPLGYHCVALALQIISLFFIYRLSFLITNNRLITFLTTLFFGLHPVHVEAAGTKTGSVDTTGVLFMFIAFYYYIRARNHLMPLAQATPQDTYNRDYKISLLFAALSTFTHELCLTIPLLWGLYEWSYPLPAPKKIRSLAMRLLPFLAITITYLFLKLGILKSVARGTYLADSFYLTMLVIIKVQVKNVLIMFFPFTLAIKHVISKGIFAVDVWDFDQQAVLDQSILDPQVLSSLLFLGLIAYAAVWAYKNNRLVFFCISWFFVSLLPAANFVPIESFFAERYLYPASWAFCLLLAYGFSLWLDQEKTGYIHIPQSQKTVPKARVQAVLIFAFLTVTAFYLTRTFLRNKDFRDKTSFFQAEVRANPQSADLWNGLANAYLRGRQPLKAVYAFKRSVAIKPQNPLYYFGWAEAYMTLEEFSYAEKVLNKALELKPDYAEAYFNLAILKVLQGDMDKAEQHASKAFDLFHEQGRWEEGQEYKKAFYEFTYTQSSPRDNP